MFGRAWRKAFSPSAASSSGGQIAGNSHSRSFGSGMSTSTISTPARASAASAASTRETTSGSHPSKKKPVGRPRRSPRKAAGRGASSPVAAAWTRAASAAARVSGPTVSSVGDSGNTPSVGSRPIVVLWPKIPLRQAGMRTEPPVSDPMAKPHSPAATATPEPLEEPPGVRWTSRSHGFHGVPRASFTPVAPSANSTVFVLPRRTQPARFSPFTNRPPAR